MTTEQNNYTEYLQRQHAKHNRRADILSRAERSRLYVFLKLDLEGVPLETIREVLQGQLQDRKDRKAGPTR